MRAFIFLAIEIANLAGKGQCKRTATSKGTEEEPTILSPILVITRLRDVDDQVGVNNTRTDGVEEVEEEQPGCDGWVFERANGAHARLRALSGGIGPLEHLRVSHSSAATGFREF